MTRNATPASAAAWPARSRAARPDALTNVKPPVKVVSERLGHASPAFTISVYQHVIPGMQADAATVFSDLVATALDPPPALNAAVDDDE